MRFPRPHCGVRGPRQNSGSIGQRWKRREALASRLVLMGRHHTNPPNPGTQPPKRRTPPQGREDRQPQTPNRASTGGTGNQTPPHPRRAHKHGQGTPTRKRGGTEEPQPLYEPRPTHPPPHHTAGQHGGRTTQSCGGHSTGETPSNIPNLEAKPGRANGTAPQGVRESRKPPQHTTRGAAHTSAAPPHTPTRQTSRRKRTQQRARGHANKQAHSTRAHNNAKNTATPPRDDARNTAHPPATQPHKTSFPAHGG